MFRVKICGITNDKDAITAVDAGADAIGLNFYEASPRRVNEESLSSIAFAMLALNRSSRFPACIGVFVNHPIQEIQRLQAKASLTGVQLHGDETPEFAATVMESCTPHPKGIWTFIRARRWDERGLGGIAADMHACEREGGRLDGVLLDAPASGAYGGTGRKADWSAIVDFRRWLGDTPLILAGGLTPDNVAEAIRIVRPAAVDVASGVESAPGKKDPAKVRDFVANALGAFDALPAI
jgi:phosphoribosylanthranilate isomerase